MPVPPNAPDRAATTAGSCMPDPLPPLPAALVARGIGVRAETAADAALLRQLYGAARADELAPVPWPAAAKEAFLDSQFALQSGHFARNHPRADFLIVTEQRPGGGAGIGRLYIERGAAPWQLLEIALLPTARNRGLGAALIGWVSGAAGEAGLELHVARDNARAEALYRRLGFRDAASDHATHRRLAWRRVS